MQLYLTGLGLFKVKMISELIQRTYDKSDGTESTVDTLTLTAHRSHLLLTSPDNIQHFLSPNSSTKAKQGSFLLKGAATERGCRTEIGTPALHIALWEGNSLSLTSPISLAAPFLIQFYNLVYPHVCVFHTSGLHSSARLSYTVLLAQANTAHPNLPFFSFLSYPSFCPVPSSTLFHSPPCSHL